MKKRVRVKKFCELVTELKANISLGRFKAQTLESNTV